MGNNHNETPRQPTESRYRLTPPKIVLANFKRKLEEQEIAREKDKTIQKQQEQLRAARVETKAILAHLKVAENEAKARTAALGDSMAQRSGKERKTKGKLHSRISWFCGLLVLKDSSLPDFLETSNK